MNSVGVCQDVIHSEMDNQKRQESLLYSAMQKAENKVGGGEGLEGVYGSITCVGTKEVLETFKEHAGLDRASIVLDIGSGLGRPLLHAILHSGVRSTYGIEVDAVKCQKACPFINLAVSEMSSHGINIPAASLPKFICAPIEQIPSLEPATHIYSAWEGFATAAKEAVGKLFAASRTAKAFTIVQRSFRNRDGAEEMAELGFGKVRQVAAISVCMAGSRRHLMAYCFVRDEMPPSRPVVMAAAGGRAGRAAAAEGAAPAAAEDLSTMPGFSPDNVIGVLAGQASDRAAAKAAAAAAGSASPQSAGDDTAAAKDGSSRPSRKGGSIGASRPAKSEATVDTSMGGSQLSDVSSHSYGLRRRGGRHL